MRRRQFSSVLTGLLVAAVAACGSGSNRTAQESPPITPAPNDAAAPPGASAATPDSAAPVCLRYERVFASLPLEQPVALLQAPDDPGRWYAVERAGRVWSFSNDASSAATRTFIDFRDEVDTYFEGGLLGMAFHPDYARNRQVFLSYTTSDAASTESGKGFRSVVARFTANDQGSALLTDSKWVLMTLPQPYGNHNGGQIAFGPDGYLYVGLGDGGSGGDPKNHAQNTRSLFGAMLRIDTQVSEAEMAAGWRYGIPPGQPFAGEPSCRNGTCPDMEKQLCAAPGCAELFAWGLRNPWRWSFDRDTGALWVGDVGQNAREEIDLVSVGDNLGWSCQEASAAYKPERCSSGSVLTGPVVDYSHTLLGSASVTGGYVYRGQNIAGLRGTYLYGDFSTGEVFALQEPYTQRRNKRLFDTDLAIVSFAQDASGELYLLSLYNPGAVFKLVGATAGSPGAACLAAGS